MIGVTSALPAIIESFEVRMAESRWYPEKLETIFDPVHIGRF